MKRLVRFATFEVDLVAGEIYREGRLVRLQQQPFEVLRALLEEPGSVVTRETLRQRLWPSGVTVDYDQSLNKSLTKLRGALGDSAASPRFVQTLPKRGYRFIAPIRSAGASESALPPDPVAASVDDQRAASKPSRRATALAGLAVSAGLLVAFAGHAPLARSLRSSDRTAIEGPWTSEPIVAARDAYERGRLALARGTASSMRQSVELFTRAIAFSPRYGNAYAELACAWSTLATDGTTEPRAAWSRARQAATMALAIDPGLAAAHAALGQAALIGARNWLTAETHFQRAIALDASNVTARAWYAGGLSAMGRHRDAEAEAYRAVAAEPFSLVANTMLGTILYRARRFDEALASVRRALDVDPDFAPAERWLGLIELQRQRPAAAAQALRVVARARGDSASALAELAHALAKAGELADARRLMARATERAHRDYGSPVGLAFGYLGLGRVDEAFSWLKRAREAEPASLVGAAVDPMWDALRTHPGFEALLVEGAGASQSNRDADSFAWRPLSDRSDTLRTSTRP